MSERTREITLPAILENLGVLTGMISDHLREHGVPGKEAFAVDLAVDEACTNVIKYAYGSGVGEITVACTVDPGEVRVCISDGGTPFDPLEVRAPDLSGSVEDRPIGGLGVHLIRSLMDRVSYEYRGGRNVLCMAKCWNASPGNGESDNL